MTGLLSVNDEVLEVNGIDVSGKTLDQVTHMMIANSENLIITVRPANQKNNPARTKSASSRQDNNTNFTGLTNSSASSHLISSNTNNLNQNFSSEPYSHHHQHHLHQQPHQLTHQPQPTPSHQQPQHFSHQQIIQQPIQHANHHQLAQNQQPQQNQPHQNHRNFHQLPQHQGHPSHNNNNNNFGTSNIQRMPIENPRSSGVFDNNQDREDEEEEDKIRDL